MSAKFPGGEGMTIWPAVYRPRDCEMTFFIVRGFAELKILKKVIMALSFELSGILWWNFAYTFIDKMYPIRLSNNIWDWLSFCRGSNSEKSETIAKMTFIIGRGFAERQILKKWKWRYLLNWVEYFDRLLRKLLILTRSSPRDCEMSFFIGRGFAELQILKKSKWLYLLNWVEHCDGILHTHWYIDMM